MCPTFSRLAATPPPLLPRLHLHVRPPPVVRLLCATATTLETEFALILMEHPEEGGNLLTKETLDLLWEVSAQVAELEASLQNMYGGYTEHKFHHAHSHMYHPPCMTQ